MSGFCCEHKHHCARSWNIVHIKKSSDELEGTENMTVQSIICLIQMEGGGFKIATIFKRALHKHHQI